MVLVLVVGTVNSVITGPLEMNICARPIGCVLPWALVLLVQEQVARVVVNSVISPRPPHIYARPTLITNLLHPKN